MVLPGYAGTYCTQLRLSLALHTHAARGHKHVTLKIGTPEALEGELRALRHFRTMKTIHPGSSLIRQMLDEFEVNSKNGLFQCVVHPPLAISIKAFRRMLPDRALPISLLKAVLKHLLLSLDFLHTEAKVIHTGKSSRNEEQTIVFYSSSFSIAVPV
jgi:serine/threonine-protein kinase SRPK3